MVINVECIFLFSRHVVKEVKRWKKQLYCPLSKWLTFSDCGHCNRIFKMQLTLDCLRVAWKRQQVNFQEERCEVKIYCRSAGF